MLHRSAGLAKEKFYLSLASQLDSKSRKKRSIDQDPSMDLLLTNPSFAAIFESPIEEEEEQCFVDDDDDHTIIHSRQSNVTLDRNKRSNEDDDEEEFNDESFSEHPACTLDISATGILSADDSKSLSTSSCLEVCSEDDTCEAVEVLDGVCKFFALTKDEAAETFKCGRASGKVYFKAAITGEVVIVSQESGKVLTAITSTSVELRPYSAGNDNQEWLWNRHTGVIESNVCTNYSIVILYSAPRLSGHRFCSHFLAT